MSHLALAHGLGFEDLYNRDGLVKIDQLFLQDLKGADSDLHDRLIAARAVPGDLEKADESQLILDLSPHLENFAAALFHMDEALGELIDVQTGLEFFFKSKRNFVQRLAAKTFKAEEAESFDGPALWKKVVAHAGKPLNQASFARVVSEWEKDPEVHAEGLDAAKRYAAWAVHTIDGQAQHHDDVLFHKVVHVDYENLVEGGTVPVKGVDALCLDPNDRRHRDGFNLTDRGSSLLEALDQSHYCVICHERGRDACSHGLRDRKTGEIEKNPLGVELWGCPLEEKISEMHLLMNRGHPLAAVATAMVDNPLMAGTGHRICNDCMKSCIFQKQEPVNIPQVETRALKNLLTLPYGFEIYSLLSRWNPLNVRRPLPRPDTGYRVLVVGLGPAGYSLAHHLMNEGHSVVAVDGLKIEPLDPALSGRDEGGNAVDFHPVEDYHELWEDLDSRAMAGFGGVAEYGITVRWDKNFLKAIRLLLERRDRFAMYGGVRFGSTMTDADAFALGFDHIALCAGAGKPTVLDIPNNLARGVRQASDFLMALQLTGAAKMDSVANLQLRLPVVVVGGGLTAIDTATESLAYYVRQVEKFLHRYEVLVAENGEAETDAMWQGEEADIAKEFLDHGRALRQERMQAHAEGRIPDFAPMLDAWGGATVAYRRRMVDSPAYRLNHEEINKALEEGIRFAELLGPVAVEVDDRGHCTGLRVNRMEMVDGRPKATAEELGLPAGAVLIAAGTQPNTTLARELPGFAAMDGKYYQALSEEGDLVSPEWAPKPENPAILMRQEDDGRAVSFFGDQHPTWAGNVVKAMASAKLGYPVIDRVLAKRPPSSSEPWGQLVGKLNDELRATVHEVKRLTPTIIEVILKAPGAARRFKPGQFFRLQNFEAHAIASMDTRLAMEGIALTGAWVDVDQGLVSVIVLEMGGSSNLCIHLKPGEPVVLMGPTGAPTETPGGETVMLCGGGLGNAVLFSVGQALRAAGSKVLYFAGYKGVNDRYHIENIEKAADVIVWTCDEAPGFEPGRPQDKNVVGNIVQAMVAYADGSLGDIPIPMSDVDRIIAIGSDRMMNAVGQARHDQLKPFLKGDHVAFGSINSPMQCMMKEICAQCLQAHHDPDSGERSVVFSCFNQDQELDRVDFDCLHQRLMQNGVAEKLTRAWIARTLEEAGVETGV
ncbi:FAD-dependent oxidoreductase [Magnetospira sp. QH-2]|uniref:FAD-dependent oxidoreductase n=1 Tax=Magnetospira sp. (strain QH-2) TaxID=1288970 RepID=UPI0003E8139A|nr:FAD-dependent oxidoreductase [Magnetospira sp. QH-2]CCQ74712.1 putative Pyridine nucleotide-disulphide oxidoreductase [Magnetospira sp. QH-2]